MENIMEKYEIGHKHDAGLDFGFNINLDQVIEAHETICLELPVKNLSPRRGTCVIPFIRSKYAIEGLLVQPTVIDAGYTGTCHVWITNLNDYRITLDKDKEYFQLVTFKIREWRKINGIKVTAKNKGKRGSKRDVTR